MWNQLLHIVLFQEGSYSDDLYRQQSGRKNSAADLASRDLYSDALGLPIRAKHEAPSYSNT